MTDFEIQDRSRVGVLLLEECNFDCPHCMRSEEPMAPGYRLGFEELRAALGDCRRLETVTWVHLTGGEPTLWSEGNRDLVDLLALVSGAGLDPSFTTNGSAFLEPGRCRDFLGRYLSRADRRLILYFSIDTFHDNFDAAVGRAPGLDAALAVRDGLPPRQAKLLDLRITSTVSKSPDSSLPEAMVSHYRSRGVTVGFAPLRCAGRARALRDECPELEDPRSDAATSLLLVGSAWHLHFYSGTRDDRDRWLEVGKAGRLPEAIVRKYARHLGG